jgi:hypothetical protein
MTIHFVGDAMPIVSMDVKIQMGNRQHDYTIPDSQIAQDQAP